MTEDLSSEKGEMAFLDHLVDLRKRVVRALQGVLIAFLLVYHFSQQIFDWLMKPLCNAFQKSECPVVYTGVIEPFMIYLKVGFVGALFASAPWTFYQLWLFIRPGLKESERKWVIPFVTIASIMLIGGALFGYFAIFPFAFEFFLKQAPEAIRPMLSMSDYFSFSTSLLFAFGVLFEIPVMIVLLNALGVVKAATLWRTWRIGVAAIFVVAAILTPADPYTLLLLGGPLSAFYLLSLAVCSLSEFLRGRSKDQRPVES